MVRLLRVSRETLRERYGDDVPNSFVPTHRVETLERGQVLWTDFVDLRHPQDKGIAYAFTPLERAYAVLPGGMWQSLHRGGGQLRVVPVKMDCRTFVKSGVYFVVTSAAKETKIGWSEDIDRRISTLQVAHADTLILRAWIPSSDPNLEKAIQDHFLDHHIRGEWYVLPLNFIESLQKLGYSIMESPGNGR